MGLVTQVGIDIGLRLQPTRVDISNLSETQQVLLYDSVLISRATYGSFGNKVGDFLTRDEAVIGFGKAGTLGIGEINYVLGKYEVFGATAFGQRNDGILVLQNRSTGDYHISFSGTDFSEPGDLLADGGIGAVGSSLSLTADLASLDLILQRIPAGSTIYLSGHSLGGARATEVAKALKDRGYNIAGLVPINSPGVRDGLDPEIAGVTIHANHTGDVVNYIGDKSGIEVRFSGGSARNPIQAHKGDYTGEAIQSGVLAALPSARRASIEALLAVTSLSGVSQATRDAVSAGLALSDNYNSIQDNLRWLASRPDQNGDELADGHHAVVSSLPDGRFVRGELLVVDGTIELSMTTVDRVDAANRPLRRDEYVEIYTRDGYNTNESGFRSFVLDASSGSWLLGVHGGMFVEGGGLGISIKHRDAEGAPVDLFRVNGAREPSANAQDDDTIVVYAEQRRLSAFEEFLNPPDNTYLAFGKDGVEGVRAVKSSGQYGSIFGSALTRGLLNLGGVGGVVVGVGGSALGRVTAEFGANIVKGLPVDAAFSDAIDRLPSSLTSAGIGAISSLLTAELVESLGIDGFAGELANAAGSAVLTQLISNLPALVGAAPTMTLGQALSGVNFGQVFGSFLGAKLASELVSFETIGGQIGASFGSAAGALALSSILGVTAGTTLISQVVANFLIPGLGAFVGFLLGGLIGSLFGGTPRSGADVEWDSESQHFTVDNVWSKKGGSKKAALGLAQQVADTYNATLAVVGGTLIDPDGVQAGNYGMRKSAFVYRPISSRDKDDITASFKGKKAATDLVNHGLYFGLRDISERVAGGNVFAKRALAATLSGSTGQSVAVERLSGNLMLSGEYALFFQNVEILTAFIAANAEDAEALGWVATIAAAKELGLHKRNPTDWIGGIGAWLDSAADDVIDGVSWSPALVRGSFIAGSQDRLWIFDTSTGALAGFIEDTILSSDKDRIVGTSSNDTIDVLVDSLTPAPGVTINGAPPEAGATTFKIDVAAVIDGGAGDDVIRGGDLGNDLLGGLGDDTLIGGKLDDWLIGGDGNDRLFAGHVATPAFTDGNAAAVTAAIGAAGGNGNYLDGGAGSDRLFGSLGSDWLRGGDGADVLHGGAGGDILDAGAGDDSQAGGPSVFGGAGSDQYVFGYGSGIDVIFDDPANSTAPGATGDSIHARIVGIDALAVARNWAGDGEFSVDGNVKGGEDAVVFGAGVTMGDIVLERGGAAGTPNMDLIIRLQTPGTDTWSGDTLTIKDWFEGTRRVEWLRFASGEEIRIGDFVTFKLGTAGADVIVGTNGDDFLYGGEGDDKIFGLAGDDFGVGGGGNDLVSGDADNDWVLGGEDDDVVLGGKGNDTVFGDTGNDRVYGGAGNDLVVGGKGDDEVIGGLGDDIFRYNRGDGRDTIFDELAGTWELVWENGGYTNGYSLNADGTVTKSGVTYFDGTNWLGRYDYDELSAASKKLYRHVAPTVGSIVAPSNLAGSGTDTLEFGAGIDIDDLVFRDNGGNLDIAITRNGGSIADFSAATDMVTLKDWYTAGPGIENFQFIETGKHTVSTMTLRGIEGQAPAELTAGGGSHWITGDARDNVITGSSSGDILSGGAGTDTLKGLAGVDVLFGGAGDDTLEGGADADELVGGSGSDTASYASYNPSTSYGLRSYLDEANRDYRTWHAEGDRYTGIENLTGSKKADILQGDAGDNLLDGDADDDTLHGGAGDDTYILRTGSGQDTITDKPVSLEMVVDKDGYFDPNRGYSLEWTYQGFVSSYHRYRLKITAAGGEVVYDSGTSGSYYKYTTTRADAPGKQADGRYLTTGWQHTSTSEYWKNGFSRPSSYNFVVRSVFASGDGGVDTLEIGEGLSLADIYTVRTGNDLEVRLLPSGADRVTITDFYAANDAKLEVLQFQDGLAANLANLRRFDEAASADDDLFIGHSSNADSWNGGAGDDVISGLGGNDTLAGGDGDDVIEGGAGSDTIDGGSDTQTAGGAETSGGFGDTARYVKATGAVVIDLASAATNIAVTEAGTATDTIVKAGGVSTIEHLVGSEGYGDTLTGDTRANRLFGLGGNDTLIGGGGDDVLVGDAGADTLAGGDGDDNIDAGEGDDVNVSGGAGKDLITGAEGNDVLYGDAGDDLIDGGDGNDVLYGGADHDQLGGGAGSDTLHGEGGNDQLAGGEGNDTLNGGDGNDTLAGEAGDDTLGGGAGDDTYVFDANSGVDLVSDTGGANRVVLSGVEHSAVWLTRAGNDLKIGIIGGSSAITVRDYYAAVSPSRIREVVAGNRSIFLGYASSLITAMTAASPSAPVALPADLAADVEALWWLGGKAPPQVAGQVRTTLEDTPLAGSVGAVDHDENITGYAVATAAAHGSVALNGATGAWTYTPTANYWGSDSFAVEVADADGQKAVQTVSVAVTSVNDAPSAITLAGAVTSIAERDRLVAGSNPQALVLGTLAVTDVDAPDPGDFASHAFSVDNSAFEVVDGQLRLKASARPDFEAGATIAVMVTATDRNGSGAGLSKSQSFSFALSDVDDHWYGGSGIDTITASGGRSGLGGRDIVYGYASNDTLYGRAGNDDLYGGADNDTLYGEDGADRLYGEDGNDSLWGGNGSDLLDGGAGNDMIDAGSDASADVLAGGSGDDTLLGGAGNDTLSGGDGNDALSGGAGADVIDGGLGVDTASYASSAAGVSVYLANSSANAGGDAAGDAMTGIENVVGTAFADTIVGDAAANWIEGGSGGDWLQGEDGNDTLHGQAGADTLHGMAGGDSLHGGADGDTLDGGGGNDALYGDDGSDALYGGDGDDMLDGGAGNDSLDGGNGNDTYLVWSTSGADTINNFDPNGTDIDVVGYQGGIARENLWFERSGNDLVVTVVGTGASTRIANWYTITTAADRANYKIDFFVAGDRFSREVNAEGLVTLMAGYAKPATQAAFDALRANATFNSGWLGYWENNQAPMIDAVAAQTRNEDGTLSLAIRVTDDITPASGISVVASAVNPTNINVEDLSKVYAPTVGAADGSGHRPLTVITKPNASGLVKIKVDAVDAGGLSHQRVFDFTINPVVDTPALTRVQGTNGTLDTGGLPLFIEATLADTDGSEVIDRIRVSNVPAALGFNMGSKVGGVWEFTPTRIGTTSTYTVAGLQLSAAAGWSQDLTGVNALQVTATAKELATGLTATTAASPLSVVVNTRPTDIAPDGALSFAENTPNSGIAWLGGSDPDGDALSFAIVTGYNAGGRYSVRSDGLLSIANAAAINHEAAASHTIRVRVTDNGSPNLSYEEEFTIGVGNVNEPNELDASYASFSSNENNPVGTPVGEPIIALDLDAAGHPFAVQRYYFWNGSTASATSSDGRFSIDPLTGRIKVYAPINYEGGPETVTYTVIARDNAGDAGFHQASTLVPIKINDLNEAPTLAAGQIVYIPENQPGAGQTSWGAGGQNTTLVWSDPDSRSHFRDNVFTYVSGPTGANGQALFSVSQTGAIVLQQSLDFETAPSGGYIVRVRVADRYNGSLSSEQNINVRPTNANDAPDPYNSTTLGGAETPAILYSYFYFPGPPTNGRGFVNANDADGPSPYTYIIANKSSSSLYVTVGINGAVEAFGAGTFDVIVSDSAGAQDIINYVVRFNNIVAPVVLDLDGDGVELVSVAASSVSFDMNLDGIADRTGWAASDDGFLFLDRNGNGAVDDASEISFATDLEDARSDLEGLQAFDTDGDGFFDTDDVQFAEFKVWQDINQDGVSQAGELTSLAERGIRAINLTLTLTGELVEGATDNVIWATSEYILNDGTTRDVGDVFLAYYPTPPAEPAAAVTGLGSLDAAVDGDERLLDTGRIRPTVALPKVQFAGLPAAAELPQALKREAAPLLAPLTATATATAARTLAADPLRYAGLSDAQVTSMGGSVPARADASSSKTGGAVEQAPLTSLAGTADSDRLIGTAGADRITGGAGDDLIYGAGGYDVAGLSGKASKYELVTQDGTLYVTGASRKALAADGSDALVSVETLAFADRTIGLAAPIILDIDGGGVNLKRLKKSKVRFDMDGDGAAEKTSWIGKGDAFLVLDRNGNGVVDSGRELSFADDLPGARSDLEGLRVYDSNGDGVLSADDARFGEFKLWRDRNRNGRSDAGELVELAELGVSAINLVGEAVNRRWAVGDAVIVNKVTFSWADGRSGEGVDAVLGYEGGKTAAVQRDAAAIEGRASVGGRVGGMLGGALRDAVSATRQRPAAELAPTLGTVGGTLAQAIGAFDASLGRRSAEVRSARVPVETFAGQELDRFVEAMAAFGGLRGSGLEPAFVRPPEPGYERLAVAGTL